jgi:ParB-like chromosome segregation protein Spo0J
VPTATKKAPPKKVQLNKTGTVNVLVKDIVTVNMDDILPYPKNPRIGNLAVIEESIRENGLAMPLFVQKSTNYCLSGNQTMKVLIKLGVTTVPVVYLDVDDERAAKLVLVLNRANDLATYNPDILAEVMKIANDPVGTGYTPVDYAALTDAIEYHDVGVVQDVIRPDLSIVRATELADAPMAVIKKPVVAPPTAAEREAAQAQDDEEDATMATVDPELQGVLQLNQDKLFDSTNYYGIPDLAGGDSLLDKLPSPLDTWAGWEVTPDDGTSWWLWNYGVAAKKNLPADRAILCFYTYDEYFESWWDEPAFQTARALNMGIRNVVVPDFSFYSNMPTVVQIYNVYRAQWMGRFFQEAGMKVIPRIQFSINDGGKSLDFCMAGIPTNPPILAASVQNTNTRDEFKETVENMAKCLQALHPTQLLVYGGGPAVRMLEAVDPVNKGLCDEVVHLRNYADKRRGIAYDKKEGLQGKKKEINRRKRDKYDDGTNEDLESETVEETPKSAARRAANKKSKAQDEADED